MPRTTAERVAAIIEVDDSDDLTEFISAANELVTELCAAVMEDDGITPYLTNTRLAIIETWLAAHFYATLRPRAHVDQVGLIRNHFESKVELRLQNSSYGQHAMSLDTTGALAAYNNALGEAVDPELPGVEVPGKTFRVSWLGSSS